MKDKVGVGKRCAASAVLEELLDENIFIKIHRHVPVSLEVKPPYGRIFLDSICTTR